MAAVVDGVKLNRANGAGRSARRGDIDPKGGGQT